MSYVTLNTGVPLFGLALVVWGLFGHRIKRLFGLSSPPHADALASLPEALQNRLVTLESWFQGHERRIDAAVQGGDMLREEVDGLKASLSEMADQIAAAEKRSQEEVARVNAAKAGVRELSKAATGRSFEILIDKMIVRLRKLTSPNAVHEYCGGDEEAYLKAVEEFAEDLLECSKP